MTYILSLIIYFSACIANAQNTFVVSQDNASFRAGSQKIILMKSTSLVEAKTNFDGIDYEGKTYRYIRFTNPKTSVEQGGFVDNSYLSGDGKLTAKTANIYQRVGYDWKYCQDHIEEAPCREKISIPAMTVIETKNIPSEVIIFDQKFHYTGLKQADGKIYNGWIREEALTKVQVAEDLSETEGKGTCMSCKLPEVKQSDFEKNILAKAKESAAKAQAAPKKPVVYKGVWKTPEGIEKFLCKFSSLGNVNKKNSKGQWYPTFSKEKFCSEYAGGKEPFRDLFAKAEEAFDLPRSLVACTMLIESTFKFIPCKGSGACGYGQFLKSTVRNLKNNIRSDGQAQDRFKAYSGKDWPESCGYWANKKYIACPIDDMNVREGNTGSGLLSVNAASVAATGMNLRYIWETFVDGKCDKCSLTKAATDRKSNYLSIIGYNLGPSFIPSVIHRNTDDIASGAQAAATARYNKSPTKINGRIKKEAETFDDYINKIDECMTKGQFDTFNGKTAASDRDVCEETCK